MQPLSWYNLVEKGVPLPRRERSLVSQRGSQPAAHVRKNGLAESVEKDGLAESVECAKRALTC
eukprot:3653382-Rhodomonas_salina.1